MSDKSEVGLWSRIMRAILGRGLDLIIYTMLGLSFKIFFNIASAELFTNETIKNFVGRVQLVIGVFMMFKLAVAIVKGIIDPDSFMDKKGGIGNLVTRVIFALVMLTLVVPINIPGARNEYEVQLNNNGLLFGTLYSLQNRILSNNTLGHLILGTTNNNYSFTTENGEAKLEEMSNMITSTVLKAFVKINVKDESQPETDSSNWLCEDLDSSLISTYTNPKSTASEILDLTKETCDNNILPGTGEVYAFSYLYFASGIAGVIFVVLMVGFSIDVAKRAIKLAVLRLIAPVPIISYIDPSTQKKSFDSWVNAVISTYIDLFVRLALVYFVIFLISDIVANGLVISEATGMVGGLTVVFIFIGLFYFAKEAPKFFMDLFGIKGSGGKLFGGFGEILGVGATAAGALSGIATNYRSSLALDSARKKTPNHAKAVVSGLAGGVAGAWTSGKAAFTAKDHQGKAALDAVYKRNTAKYASASDGSTIFGRSATSVRRAFTGQTAADIDQNYIAGEKSAIETLKAQKEPLENRKKANKAVLDFAGAEAKKKPVIHSGTFKKADGTSISTQFAYNDLTNRFLAAKDLGSKTFTVTDVNGNDIELSTEKYAAESFLHDKNATFEYIDQYRNGAFGQNYEYDALVAEISPSDLNNGVLDGATLKSHNEQLTGNIIQIDSQIKGHNQNISNRQTSKEFKQHAANDKATKPGGGK